MPPITLLGAGLLAGGFVVMWGVLATELRPRRPVVASRVLAPPRPLSGPARWALCLLSVALTDATILLSSRHIHNPAFLALWYCTAAVLSMTLLAHAIGRRHLHRPVAAGRVLAVVPTFNEPAGNLYDCVGSLLAQTVPVDVVVVDDGSTDPVPGRWKDRVRWIYQPNTGKAGAQVAALRMFHRDEYDFVLTVDSDSMLYPDAAAHLLRAMTHAHVQAATGWMYVRNHASTLVTMAADIEIGISCVTGRASRSLLGAMESTSGALALYRAALVYDHLDEYAANPASVDDDRWLTTRALRRGQVVAVNEAVVATDMPETVAGTWKQRVRWSRSWFVSLPYVLGKLGLTAKISPVLGAVEIVAMPLIVGYAMYTFVLPVLLDRPGVLTAGELGRYVLALVLARYCQAALYLFERPARSRAARLHALLLGTLGEIALSGVLLPLARYRALLQVRSTSWGGRAGGGRRTAVPVVASAQVPGHRYRPDWMPGRNPSAAGPALVPAARHAVSNELTSMMPRIRPDRRVISPGRRRAGGNRR